ncbi:MAG: molybdenum cofactor biosynthesis protein MoaE [Gammaproteobacteria bacterium]
MTVTLTRKAFDPWQALSKREADLARGQQGACATFIGTMRDFNLGDSVHSMTLEHYPEMTQQFLESAVEDAVSRWNLVDCLIIHRHGKILPGDAIVLVAAWSAHRAEAFDACRFLIEELKARAPFWKKETTDESERWVHDTPNS